MRRYFIVPLIAFLLFIVSSAFAETVTFTKEYTYQASDFDSMNSSRTLALETVKRLLLEELGTYLVSEAEVKDMRLTKDQVTTYSAGIVGAEIIDEKWDGKSYWLKAKVSADPKEVEKTLKKLAEDKSKTKELEETRKKAEELTKENERLRRELRTMRAKTENVDKEPEKKDVIAYEKTIIGLNAVGWFEKGYKAGIAKRWEDSLDAFIKAVELKPDDAEAYYNMGFAYYNLGNYQEAIKDYDKTIGLNPDFVKAYVKRGFTYYNLGNKQQAIKDYTNAIELKPDDARVYVNRGVAYAQLGNHLEAIHDFSKAIERMFPLKENNISTITD